MSFADVEMILRSCEWPTGERSMEVLGLADGEQSKETDDE